MLFIPLPKMLFIFVYEGNCSALADRSSCLALYNTSGCVWNKDTSVCVAPQEAVALGGDAKETPLCSGTKDLFQHVRFDVIYFILMLSTLQCYLLHIFIDSCIEGICTLKG